MNVSEKYVLTVKEAAEYFNIGIKKLRQMAADNPGSFSIMNGHKLLIVRVKLERFLDKTSAI